VDVVNHFKFPDGDAILKNALQIAPRLSRLKKRARASNIPVVYVNDNFGQWKSDAAKLLAHCLRTDCSGKPFVEAIQPDRQDYCVQANALGIFPNSVGPVASTPGSFVHHPRGHCHEQLHSMHGA
jgi:nicotinamidase-related amidase